MARLLLSLLILCSMLIAFCSCRSLCSRIFFQNITEETLPYKIIYSVYTKENRRVNFYDNPVIVPVVLISAVILESFMPFIIYRLAMCMKSIKECTEEQEDQRRLQEVDGELQRRLEQVARAGSEEELDRGVQDYQQTVQEYQRENKDKELSRKRGLYRNASLWRIISMHLFFSFYLWIVYLVGCEISQCTQYGRIFVYLKTFAIVMLCISSVYIFIESIFSHELDYLRNIMQDETAWGYIEKMHEVAPRIGMVVECYHFETRTRVVYYTDANGNRQSRTETYTERVVTFVDHDEFSFGSWVDVSKREMPALSTVSLTRVRIDPYVLFGDQETADDYERQAAAMIERNRHRDAFTDFSASREIPAHLIHLAIQLWDLPTRPHPNQVHPLQHTTQAPYIYLQMHRMLPDLLCIVLIPPVELRILPSHLDLSTLRILSYRSQTSPRPLAMLL